MRLTSPSHKTKHRASRTSFARSERLLDAIPGGLAWLALLAVLAGSLTVPMSVLSGVALLATYTALRLLAATMAVLHGLRAIRRWEHNDWHHAYTQRRMPDSLPLETVQHLVIIPTYNEPATLLHRTLAHLSAQHGARRAITVVLAMEAANPDASATGERLQAAFADHFADIIITQHPPNLPGEMQCKSANLAWALRHARRIMIHERGINPDHVLVTAMDADTIWHAQHFTCLTVLFATSNARHRTYWQAPLRYHGNVWSSHPLLRMLHAYASGWELAYLAAPWWQTLPMSSYAVSLRLLDTVGGWDADVIADDWHMALKSYFRLGGEQQVAPVFLPFQVHAVAGSELIPALRERYRQTFRHAWGAKEIGYTIAQYFKTPTDRRPARARTLGLLLRVAHDNLLAGAGWIVLFLGAQLPLLFHPATVRAHVSSTPVLLFQAAIVIVSALTILFWLFDLKTRPPRPGPWTWRERVLELASVPLLAVLTVIGVALPVMHAQTRLLRGKPLAFRVTPKT